MAVNDSWSYTRGISQLPYTVYAVNMETGEAKARAAFYIRADAELFATISSRYMAAGPDWEFAVENQEGGVTWTSF